MDLGLKGRTVLVTGASGGIGKAIAEAFGRDEANVAITYHRDATGAENTVRNIIASDGKAVAFPMVLQDEASINQAVDNVVTTFGEISILVNNVLDWSNRGEVQGFEDTLSSG